MERKASEQAMMLRICASRGGCKKCPLDNYVGCCSDKLKRDSAELIEDQQAVIQEISEKLAEMVAAISRLEEKYGGNHGEEV